ncbi:MAG: hypothetical protein HY906_01915 [Deltaproteobacteria bacterium]|nr:hypothetical protein [Deltaproteobacteria bacterium]
MTKAIHAWIDRVRAAHARADAEEYARVRASSQAERIEALKAASRTGAKVLAAMSPGARERALRERDPLPEPSQRALARLRQKARIPWR